MKLYSYWRSSSAWRVRIGLAWKEVECDIIPVHLVRGGGEQRLPEFLARNPLGQVPVLEVDDGDGKALLLTQSVAILEYLEERYPHPPLLPSVSAARAQVRRLTEIINSGTQPYQNLRLQNALRATGLDPGPLVRELVGDGLRALEEYARASAGRFMVGDSPTFADIMLVPQLYAARRLAIDVEGGAFSTLLRVEAVCATLPAFQRAHANAQPDAET